MINHDKRAQQHTKYVLQEPFSKCDNCVTQLPADDLLILSIFFAVVALVAMLGISLRHKLQCQNRASLLWKRIKMRRPLPRLQLLLW